MRVSVFGEKNRCRIHSNKFLGHELLGDKLYLRLKAKKIPQKIGNHITRVRKKLAT